MAKRITLLLFICCPVVQLLCFAGYDAVFKVKKHVRTDLEKLNLKGPVKSVTETEWIIDRDDLPRRLMEKCVTKFNWAGNTAEFIRIDQGYSEERSTRKIFKYDVPGNQVEEYDTQEANQGIIKFSRSYDGRGNKTEERVYLNWPKTNGCIIHVYKYDEFGNMIECLEDPKGKTDYYRKYTYKYDGKGNEIENVEYWRGGEFIQKFAATYYNNGDMASFGFSYDTIYHPLEDPYIIEYCSIDKNGNWTEKAQFSHYYPERDYERVIEYY